LAKKKKTKILTNWCTSWWK